MFWKLEGCGEVYGEICREVERELKGILWQAFVLCGFDLVASFQEDLEEYQRTGSGSGDFECIERKVGAGGLSRA